MPRERKSQGFFQISLFCQTVKILLTLEKKLAIIYFVFAVYDTEGKEVRKDEVRV